MWMARRLPCRKPRRGTMGSQQGRDKVRYAVVGLGNIAQVAVLPAFQSASDNSELVALISSDPDKLNELGRRYDVAHCGNYSEFESIIVRAGVDAIYLTVPNTLHRTFTERAAACGVHVLCEKPLATTTRDALAMIRAC